HPVNLPVIVPPIVSSVVEGHTGTTNLIFRLAIQPACRLPVSVNFQTLEVGARAGVDFLGTNGVILIPAGATNADLAVGVLGDALDETSESLNLRFFSPTNAIVLYPAVRGTIQDDDPTPKLAVDDVTVTEGPPGTTRPARFIVRLSAPSALEIAANYRVAARLSGTNAATAGSDYEPASGTLVFAPGTTQQVVTVTVHGDRFFEPVEEFALTFSEPTNVTLEDGEGVGTIVDDDAGALDRFSWNFIPSPQRLGRPFPVTITARDAQANVVSNFDGAVDLRALAHTGEIAVGHGTNGWAYPLATSFHDARTQIIYPAEELAGAGTLNGLSLFVLTAPGQTLSNWTLRLRHTPLASYTVPAWEGEGWTTVYQRDETIRADGWVTFHFDRPFAYDGTNHLMVDLSFDNASYSRDGWCAAFETSGRRALVFQTDSAFGDPRQWQGGVSPRPVALNRALNVRWSFERPLRLVPAQTTSFSRGVWTGEITVFDAAPNVLLRAVGPEGVGGTSLAFAVESDADTNHNGLPDDWELACFGFLYPEGEGADDDPDQDGRTNSAEYLAGTHPADGWSVLAIAGIEQRDGGVRLRFTTVAGRRYQIEWATDLARPVWQSLGPPVEGRGDTVTVTDAGGGGGNRFYRVRVGP
ncbi:MAG TPA: Calx-beta domain-containing protein, partial [Methylomirabilota bacterium]|nr:Calx-beta domain-containing protein [Methylomirabilota bacterium]